MTVSSTGSSSLDKITGSYQPTDTSKKEESDVLGRDAFLTMLVAQLQNQDPLNPMDGTDFSAQLAQFSQLEQLINLNTTMEDMASALTRGGDKDAVAYIGKQVTGNVNTMNVDDGTVSGGFYNLSGAADVKITVTDEDGKIVKTLYEGQQNAGSHIVSWDGTDNNGAAVTDGSYKYTVLADSGYGYAEISSSVTGKVDGVAYSNGRAYLVVQGVLLDVESLTSVSGSSGTTDTGSGSVDSALGYMGRTVTSNAPILLVQDGAVSGGDLTFALKTQDSVTIKVYDVYDELVRTISLSASATEGGDNTVQWNGLGDSGHMVADGLYYYTVSTGSGYAATPVTEEVSGIKYMNGGQYLVLRDTGRLVSVSTITDIQE